MSIKLFFKKMQEKHKKHKTNNTDFFKPFSTNTYFMLPVCIFHWDNTRYTSYIEN